MVEPASTTPSGGTRISRPSLDANVEGAGALDPSIPRPVQEASYLTAHTNAPRYRVITHFLHLRYKEQRHHLKPREIWQYVREVYEPTYTIEQCESDLNALAAWGNVVAQEDRERVGSVEEWRSRDRIFSITPLTIRLEEALDAHRHDGGSRGSLETGLIETILANLDALNRSLEATGPDQEADKEYVRKHIRLPWREIHRQFTDLTTNANAFHHELREAHPADPGEVEAFRIYKDVLLDSLSGFINELVDAGEHLRGLMRLWRAEGTEQRLINLLAAHESQTQTDVAKGTLVDYDTAVARYSTEITAIVNWFMPAGGMDALRRTTRNAIEDVVRITARITDRMRSGTSRRDDLTRLAMAFARCETPHEAHVLGALTLGSPVARHVIGAAQWGLMTDTRSVWEQAATEVAMRRIVRGRRPKARPVPVVDRSAAQAELLRLEEEAQRREQAAWDALFAEGPIDVGNLSVGSPEIRDRLLDALDSCLLATDHRGVASDGSTVRMVMPEPDSPMGTLVAPDGRFVLPRYRLIRESAEAEAA